MGITVTEKQELRDIINGRVEKKIQQLKMANETDFSKMEAEARKVAIHELGIGDYAQRHEDIEVAISRLNKEKDKLEKEACEKLGVKSDWHRHDYIEERIKSGQEIVVDRMMKGHPVGLKILTLKKEQDRLLETVWIATSTAQVKELFERVNEILDEGSTPLGEKAQDIEPTNE